MNFQLKNMHLTKIEISLACLFLLFYLYPFLSFFLEPFLYKKILTSLSFFTFAYIIFAIIVDKNVTLVILFLLFSMMYTYCLVFVPTEYHNDWSLIKNEHECSIIQKNLTTHDVYWKCDNGIIYINKHEI